MAKIKTPDGYFHYKRKNLYLGIKQINKNIALNNLKDFIHSFSNADIKIFPMFGTLLGMIRENDFITWDEDIDMCIFKEDEPKLLQLLPELKSKGFELVRYERRGLYSFMKLGEYIDIYVLINIGDGILTTYASFFLERDVKNLTPYNFKGIELSIPENYESVLELLYGDWKTPMKYANFSLSWFQRSKLKIISQIKNHLPDWLYFPLLRNHHKTDFFSFISKCQEKGIVLNQNFEYKV